MFDNIAINVVIGLVVIYLLYSLLVTIVSEILSNWLGLRPRILRMALGRMLNDSKTDKSLSQVKGKKKDLSRSSFARFMLREPDGFENTFAGRFYAQPAIKYLARSESRKVISFKQTKPSYLTPATFGQTIISMLTERGLGADRKAQLDFALRVNSLHIQPESLRYLRDLWDQAGHDPNAFLQKLIAWFSDTMDRANGWYKRKLKFILFWLGLLIAVSFNIDSVRIARVLANDKEARGQLVSMGVALAKDTTRYKAMLEGNGDSVYTPAVLDSGLARVSRDIGMANLILGMGWHLDTLTCSTEISIDSAGHPAVYTFSISHRSSLDQINDLFRTLPGRRQQVASEIRRWTDSLQLIYTDTLAGGTPSPALIRQYSRNINLVKMRLRQLADSASRAKDSLKSWLEVYDAVPKTDLVTLSAISSDTSRKTITLKGRRGLGGWEKTGYFLVEFFWNWKWIGIVLTALALSLGAPFWFDLLRKLVALRSAGVKPEERKNPPSPTGELLPKDLLEVSEEPEAISNEKMALQELTRSLQNQPGLVGVALMPPGRTTPASLQVLLEEENMIREVKKRIGSVMTLSNAFSMPINYARSAPIETHVAAKGQPGDRIRNENGLAEEGNGNGTLCTQVGKKGSDDVYFMSCWHVLKDDSHWDVDPLKKNILSSTSGELLGIVEQGLLSTPDHPGIDIGFARYSQPALGKLASEVTGQCREVTSFDGATRARVFIHKSSGKIPAKIFQDTINALVGYPGGGKRLMNDIFSVIPLADDSDRPLTIPGDSGALVTDINGIPLGLVIGGNNDISYAVKFSHVFGLKKPYADYQFLISKKTDSL